MADDDEEQVQQDVDDARHREEVERLFRVAGGGKHRVAEVEHRHSGHTEAVDAQIADRARHQHRLCAEHGEHCGREKETQRHDDDADNQRENQRGMHRLVHVLVVPRADIPGDDDVDPAAHADQEAGEQRDKNRGRPD